MKKILVLVAMLLLSVAFWNQDKAFADVALQQDNGNEMGIIQLEGKQSVVLPIEIPSVDSLVRSTVNQDNIQLFDEQGKNVLVKIVLSKDLKTVMVVPTKPLSYSAPYTLRFSSNIRTLAGYNIADTVFAFTTEARPKNAKQDVTKVKKPTLSDKNLEYLISVAIKNKNEYIVKWNTGLEVALLGSPTAADKKEVAKVLKEISALTGLSAKVTTNKNKANVKIYFGTHKWGEKYLGKMPANIAGYFIANTTKKGFINQSTLFVNTKASATYKKHIIRKILTMPLGFPSETLSSSSSIFYRYGKGTSYSNLDKQIIKALYSPYIPVGTTQEQLREMFRK